MLKFYNNYVVMCYAVVWHTYNDVVFTEFHPKYNFS